MKNKLIILLLLAITWQTNAQKDDYMHLLDTNKLWVEAMIMEFGDFSIDEYWIGDTIRNNDTTFYILKIDVTSKYNRYLREDTIEKKVWYRQDFTYPEQLYYDFSMEIGDSIEGVDWPCMLYLDSIKVINYFETERKTFFLHSNWYDEYGEIGFNPVWVEGIGSLSGILHNERSPEFFFGGTTELNCYYYNDKMLYQSDMSTQYDCHFENMDLTPPVIDSIWFEPETIASNNSVSLYVKGTDDLSGINSFYTEIISPSILYNSFQASLIHQYNDVYKCDIEQTGGWNELGTWHTNFIVVWDNEGNYNECYFPYDAEFYVNEIIGIENLKKTGLKIFPNPVNQRFTITNINYNACNTYVLHVYNLSGKCVLQKHIHKKSETVSANFLNSGFYILKLFENNKQIYTNKLIKF